MASATPGFTAWATPEELKRWHAPEPMTVPLVEVDLRVGGSYRIHMREPGGQDTLTDRGDRHSGESASSDHQRPRRRSDDEPALVGERDEPEERAALAGRQLGAVGQEGGAAPGVAERQQRGEDHDRRRHRPDSTEQWADDELSPSQLMRSSRAPLPR